jgi:alkylhydroperoxidase/carboxymuconolactone decarboxylase family protein YurZ
MSAQSGGCGCGGIATERQPGAIATAANNGPKIEKQPEIIDYKITLLIAAGAAMAANCEPCLNKIVPDLIEAQVADADIRRAIEIGQFVKNKSADNMKEVADTLAGTNLLKKRALPDEVCPADKIKR